MIPSSSSVCCDWQYGKTDRGRSGGGEGLAAVGSSVYHDGFSIY